MERSEARKAMCKACSKKLYRERKEWGVCTVCGKPKKNNETTVICMHCLEKRALVRSKTRQHINELCAARRQRHKEQGLCVHCDNPAIPGQTRCEYHKKYYSEAYKKYYREGKRKK